MKICIPSISNEIKKEDIFRVFAKMKIGRIGRIIENLHYKNNSKKCVIIHIEFNESENANIIQTRLNNNQPIYLVYDQPWFWKIVKSIK